MPNVAVMTAQCSSRTHQILQGVHDFAESALDWVVQSFDAHEPLVNHELIAWGAQGLIVQLDGLPSSVLRGLPGHSIPVICFQLAPWCRPPIAAAGIAIAPASVARLIAQHLQSLAIKRIALVSRQAEAELVSAMSAALGQRFQSIELALSTSQLRALSPGLPLELQRWLATDGPRVLIAEDDLMAIYLRRVVVGSKLKIPSEVSIISLNDSLACQLPTHSITAVILPDHEIGYQAARSISRTLGGLPAPIDTLWVEALHMTCRASSVEAGQDLAIERARKFIEENATRGITVADVMTFQQTSRVTFERQFQSAVGFTPGDYIRQIKVNRAKALLLETAQSIESIGKTCGYQSPAKFSSFFKRAVGVSPASFRQRGQA